jgi:hypothetical protein
LSVADADGWVRRRLGRAAPPGQGPLQLDLQGEAEERSDQDDQSETRFSIGDDFWLRRRAVSGPSR